MESFPGSLCKMVAVFTSRVRSHKLETWPAYAIAIRMAVGTTPTYCVESSQKEILGTDPFDAISYFTVVELSTWLENRLLEWKIMR